MLKGMSRLSFIEEILDSMQDIMLTASNNCRRQDVVDAKSYDVLHKTIGDLLKLLQAHRIVKEEAEKEGERPFISAEDVDFIRHYVRAQYTGESSKYNLPPEKEVEFNATAENSKMVVQEVESFEEALEIIRNDNAFSASVEDANGVISPIDTNNTSIYTNDLTDIEANNTVSNNTVSNDTVPNDTVSNDTVPNDTVPNDTVCEEADKSMLVDGINDVVYTSYSESNDKNAYGMGRHAHSFADPMPP